MYISIQTVCICHGHLLFESLHCERCRSLIPFQLSDESLLEPVSTNNITDGINIDGQGKLPPGALVPYRKQQEKASTTGRVRLRALCPFCNSSTFIIRYYCKRERLFYHLRIQNCGENEQHVYRSIADTQQMISVDRYGIKRDHVDGSLVEIPEDSYSLGGSTSQRAVSTGTYDHFGVPTMRDRDMDAERRLFGLNELEGDFFTVLRNGLFYDTLIECQDDVKLQTHRCVLGGRSPWFRHLIAEYHETNASDDYVLQISIDDIESDIMNEILNFMYTNRCFVNLRNAPDLLIAAKRFELETLKKQIADFLLYRLTIENAIEMLICAHESGSEALKLACIRLINRNADKIKRTEKWRAFKTQYVDLVPELYENRVEHPAPPQQAFIPDVFTGPEFPSESLRTLSQLYENPVQQRYQTPVPRSLVPVKKIKSTVGPSILKTVQLVPPNSTSNDVITNQQRSDSNLSSILGRESPNKALANYTKRPIPPITRTVLPNIRQNSDADTYRRPVNVYEPSQAMPPYNQTRVPPVRTGSPKRVLEVRRQSPATRPRGNDNLTMTKIVSIEPAD